MQQYLIPALWILAAYLIGGIPFGFLIGKARGVDVRTVGSKNIGATNVLRTVGKKWGFLALFCDMMKGFVPTFLCKTFCSDPSWLPLAVGVTCALGHMLTPYMKFKGGKGVATGAGMLIGLVPALMGVTLLVFVALFALSNYISLGSCGGLHRRRHLVPGPRERRLSRSRPGRPRQPDCGLRRLQAPGEHRPTPVRH